MLAFYEMKFLLSRKLTFVKRLIQLSEIHKASLSENITAKMKGTELSIGITQHYFLGQSKAPVNLTLKSFSFHTFLPMTGVITS